MASRPPGTSDVGDTGWGWGQRRPELQVAPDDQQRGRGCRGTGALRVSEKCPSEGFCVPATGLPPPARSRRGSALVEKADGGHVKTTRHGSYDEASAGGEDIGLREAAMTEGFTACDRAGQGPPGKRHSWCR